jgi:hypothetical protein
VRRSVEWYHARHAGRKTDMVEFSVKQIDAYVAAARRKQSSWAA